MECESILQKIQGDPQERSTIELYRYNMLMQAIDFFSNRLGFEQIVASAFEFVNKLLIARKSAMYILDGNEYILYEKNGTEEAPERIPCSKKLETFAVFCGAVLYEQARLEEYLGNEIIGHCQACVMIPMITETTLEGFILLCEKDSNIFISDDIIICDALMRVFNSALENYRRLVKLQQTNSELDDKVFNLFAINESSKLLLSEHDMQVLYNLSIDVFSELTQSSQTSFFMFDESSEKHTLKAYKDIYYSKVSMEYVSLTLDRSQPIRNMKFLIDTSNPSDLEYFNSLFREGAEVLSFANPCYIVLLLNGSEVLGFVTLGNTVSGSPYKKGVFELVESLASYTYIAISNAILLDRLDQHKKLLEEKLDRLISLNRLMKNVNSAESSETLQELILRTLEISFGVEKVAFALFEPEKQTLAVSCCAGMTVGNPVIAMNSRLEKLKKGSVVLETNEQEVSHYIGTELDRAVGEKSGFLAVPIVLEKYELQLMGALLIFKMRGSFLSDEENLIVMETIANLSAPLLANFIRIEYERGALAVNHRETFLREMKRQTLECSVLDTPLEVIHIETHFPLFAKNTLLEELEKELELVYAVDHNHILILVTSDFHYCRHKVKEAAEKCNGKTVVYTMGTDFTGYEDFIERFR